MRVLLFRAWRTGRRNYFQKYQAVAQHAGMSSSRLAVAYSSPFAGMEFDCRIARSCPRRAAAGRQLVIDTFDEAPAVSEDRQAENIADNVQNWNLQVAFVDSSPYSQCTVDTAVHFHEGDSQTLDKTGRSLQAEIVAKRVAELAGLHCTATDSACRLRETTGLFGIEGKKCQTDSKIFQTDTGQNGFLVAGYWSH